jgi:transposase-like protein
MKKSHSAMLKFKVALAALKGQPIVEICQQYEVAESLVHKWKKQLNQKLV